MSKVRSSELEIGLSSSDSPIKAEVDTAASGWREGRAFHVLGEECALYTDTLFRFRDRFQFPEGVRVCLPYEGEGACHFSPRKVCFYKAAFQCGFRFLVHPFIMELLNHFNISLGQLMLNSWRIVVSCMEIWMVVIEGDMIRLDEFFTCIAWSLRSTGIMNSCLGSRMLGSSPIFHRPFNIGSQGSFLYLGMDGRLS